MHLQQQGRHGGGCGGRLGGGVASRPVEYCWPDGQTCSTQGPRLWTVASCMLFGAALRLFWYAPSAGLTFGAGFT